MSLCKPSSFAENSATLQHANKQEKLLLDKRVQFMNRQEKQAKTFVTTDQHLILKRIKTNLGRSVIAERKIAKLKAEISAESSLKKAVSQDLRTAWCENDPLSENAAPSLSTQDALPAAVSVPVAVNILRSQGRKIHPTVLRKVENLEQVKSSQNLPGKLKVPLPTAGNKHRRGSGVSTNSSGSIRFTKKRLRRHTVCPGVIHVRPASAPKAPAAMDGNKELDTAMWVASHNSAATCKSNTKCRPLSAEPKMTGDAKKLHSPLNSEQNNENELESNSGVVILVTPPDSPNLSDLRIYEESLTANSLDELLEKLKESQPQISLVDLHRATVATKNYPLKIKQFLQKIYKYKSPTTAISTDYYAIRLNAEKCK
uniref:Uncharacterized protein LOC100178235 n=1 Tax=Phallusia mammillata TaxID=59560 RepID=A0A6F9DHP3_9ASCI|nr:uncharacterized protein LOC100178235 [Phallusia mammillata]